MDDVPDGWLAGCGPYKTRNRQPRVPLLASKPNICKDSIRGPKIGWPSKRRAQVLCSEATTSKAERHRLPARTQCLSVRRRW